MDFYITALIALIIFFSVLSWFIYNLGKSRGQYQKDLEWTSSLNRIRRDIADNQRSSIKGRVTESLAPFLEGFPFKASECKFIGDPVDYIVFEGLDEREIKGVHLVEVKTENSNLKKHQKQIKEIIDSLDTTKVTFKEFRFLG